MATPFGLPSDKLNINSNALANSANEVEVNTITSRESSFAPLELFLLASGTLVILEENHGVLGITA